MAAVTVAKRRPGSGTGGRRRRRLGQHFLVDGRAAARIVALARLESRPAVLEIGPGRGALTDRLRRAASRLYLVEVDAALAQALSARYAGDPAVSVIHADVLDVDLEALIDEPVHVVGNLPYRIASQILLKLVDFRRRCPLAVVTVQDEVARRVCAPPGGRDYGILTLLVGLYAEVERCFGIGPRSFAPPPRVQSAVIRLRPQATPRVPMADPEVFRQLIRSLFQQRRKMIRGTIGGALESLGIGDPGASTAILAEAGVDPRSRPEDVSLESFGVLTGAVVRRLAGRRTST
jgi:16S rRNA (adenine1518-N6/adenine1519-N6)-dimethyltransferase